MDTLIYPVGNTKACQYALKTLRQTDIRIIDHPAPEVTHLLLDIPSFARDGSLRGGGDLAPLLRMLPTDITVVGGNLQDPKLSQYRTLDLLADPLYLAKNAAITAECALRVAAERIPFTFRKTPVLIVGWGRIGKHLAFLLKAHGSRVTILSRSPRHRAEAVSFGLHALSPQELPKQIQHFRILFNTAPAMMIPKELSQQCPNCLKIDLASLPGIEAEDTVAAKGLPGILAPESAGQLIGDTILRLLEEEEA